MTDTVLVTGANGYIGRHVVLRLLADGYRVRAAMRRPEEAGALRDALGACDAPVDRVEAVALDLTADAGWAAAMAGVTYVQHIASPFPARVSRDADSVIAPARDGALRALRFARDAGVARVVLTSSMAAVVYGAPASRPEIADEAVWSDPGPGSGNTPYIRSKTVAERAAWNFVADQGGDLTLAVVNPALVIGPMVGRAGSTSLALVKAILTGRLPAYPDFGFEMVDVRDVAEAHLRAMTTDAAAGQRFLLAERYMLLAEMGATLRNGAPDLARNVPRRAMPTWAFRALGLVVPDARALGPELGTRRRVTADKARRVLDWSPRPAPDALIETARDLAAKGMV